MTRVTRDVEPSALRGLLERPLRATVALVDEGQVEVLPARYRLRTDAHLIGVPRDSAKTLEGREVVLVIDAGAYWFELRGISVRGLARRTDPADGDATDLTWYVIDPRRVLGWDYATIR